MENKKTIILTGMHRSGTSFTASLLKNMGVNIGKSLLGPHEGNKKGHFENNDFLNFHIKALNVNELHTDGWSTKGEVIITPALEEEARNIVSKNEDLVWGWKDPRTTLMLEFWKNLIPDALFVFVFREPWEVIDSLYRRGDWIFLNFPEKAIEVWKDYNKKIFDFYSKYPERCVLLYIGQIIENPDYLLNLINQRLDTSMNYSERSLFDNNLFKKDPVEAELRSSFISYFYPEATELFINLQRLSFFKENFSVQSVQFNSMNFFKDWLKIRRMEIHMNYLEARLKEMEYELDKNEDRSIV